MSSLFQRWNLQVRQNYHLLSLEALPSPTVLRVLLISRSPPSAGPNSTHILSRMYTNTQQIVSALQVYAESKNKMSPYRVEITHSAFSSLSFLDQVTLMGESSVVIGMHGAGIASSMHMPIGTKLCCGVVEIFPEGEFKSIKGYSALARKLGHQYERVNVLPEHTGLQGTQVDPVLVVNALRSVVERIDSSGGSCYLPEVLSTPYLT